MAGPAGSILANHTHPHGTAYPSTRVNGVRDGGGGIAVRITL